MAIIIALLVSICALGSAVATRLLVDESKAWLPWIVRHLLGRAVSHLPMAYRQRYEEEWSSHLAEIPGDLARLWTAFSFLFASRRIAWSNLRSPAHRGALGPSSRLLTHLAADSTYGFVGTEDFTMYPIVLPGSFLVIDETKTHVQNEGWRTQYERPIYFIETQQEFICSWCTLENGRLTVVPHPLSPLTSRVFKYPQEAEIVGQVVGIATQLSGRMDHPS